MLNLSLTHKEHLDNLLDDNTFFLQLSLDCGKEENTVAAEYSRKGLT